MFPYAALYCNVLLVLLWSSSILPSLRTSLKLAGIAGTTSLLQLVARTAVGAEISFLRTSLALSLVGSFLRSLPWVLELRNLDGEAIERGFSGKYRPMMFFSKTIHSRFTPTKYTFKHPLLYVGFPITFEGTISGLFSVRGSRSGSQKSGLKQLFSFFDVKPEDFVNPELPFGQKLTPILHQHGLDPAMYPHVYFVTTPAFLGYSFNPVSYFYLYNAEHELKLLFLEVKNTFGEKHVYLLNRDNKANPSPRMGYDFAGTMEKTFHISPFNHRSGTYKIQVRDPIREKEGMAHMDVHMVVFDDAGNKTMMARAFAICAGFDIANAGFWMSYTAVVKWGYNTFLAIPFTMFEAFKVWRRGIKVHTRPEPKEGTGQRKATEPEQQMQEMWVEYFKDRISKYPLPLTCILTLPQSNATQQAQMMVLQSSVTAIETQRRQQNADAEMSLDTTGEYLTPPHVSHRQTVPSTAQLNVAVTDPSFFSRFFSHQDPQHTTFIEITNKPAERRPATINNLDLFVNVLTRSFPSDIGVSHLEETVRQPVHGIRWRIISWLRRLKSARDLEASSLRLRLDLDRQQLEASEPNAIPEFKFPEPTPQPPVLPSGTVSTLDAYFFTTKPEVTKKDISLYRRKTIQAMMVDTVAGGEWGKFENIVLSIKIILRIACILILFCLAGWSRGIYGLLENCQEFTAWTVAMFGIVNIEWMMKLFVSSM